MQTEDLSQRLTRVLGTLKPLVACNDSRGVPIAQRLHEEQVLGIQCGAGLVNREHYQAAIQNCGTDDLGMPVSDTTISQCASLSKPVAASWLIEYCVQHGHDIFEISVNELIDLSLRNGGKDHFEGWRVRSSSGKPAAVPVAHFLSHTSGVGGHYVFGCRQDQTVQSPLSILRGERPAGLPEQACFEFRAAAGTEMNYSGTSYVLTELLIEQLSGGKPFQQVMAEFFTRLGMLESTFDHQRVLKKTMLHSKYLRFPAAAAGMYTTTADFMLFVKAVIEAWHGRQSALSPQTAKLMLAPAINQRQFIGLDPGHGFFVLQNADGSTTFAHQGANEHFRVLVISNTHGQIIYSVANSDFGTPLNCEIARGLMQELKFPGYKTCSIPRIRVASDKLQDACGSFELSDGRSVSLACDEDNDLVRTYDNKKIKLFALDSTGTKFVHSTTGKTYVLEGGNTLLITNINNTKVSAKKCAGARRNIYDDRAYDLDDPAKLVNLQIRDALDLDQSLADRLC